MEWSRNLVYQGDDWKIVKFDKEANLSTEIKDFLSDSKIDKTELKALHYILFNNKELSKKQEILKTTNNLSLLSNTLNTISFHTDKYHIKSRINGILKLKLADKSNTWNIDNMEWLSEEFPNIKNTSELKKLINNKVITKENILSRIKQWVKLIKVKYNNWKTEKINVNDLSKFYNDINGAREYVNKSAKYSIGIPKKNWEVDYKKMSSFAEKSIDEIGANKIKNLIISAQKYYHWKEKWIDKVSKELRSEIKKFWLDINKANDYWCAAFIWICLVQSKNFNNINELKKIVRNPLRAASYLWWKDFAWHIWISLWNWIMINWNSWNTVQNRYMYKNNAEKIVWWVMPENVWNKDAVNYLKKPNLENKIKEIPVGAIVVFRRWWTNKNWS